MKFEDKINAIIKTLNEDIGTGAQPMAGNPNAVNPAQVAPQAGQQPQQQPQAGQAGEVTADQLMQFALNSDPKQLQTMGIDPNSQGDDLFKAVHAAFSKQGNTPTGTTSAAPVSNTAGVQGL